MKEDQVSQGFDKYGDEEYGSDDDFQSEENE